MLALAQSPPFLASPSASELGLECAMRKALWIQCLDRHIAHSTDSSDNARFDEPQAAHTALRRWHGDSQRRYQTPGQRPNGPAAPGR
jgi:hypothetical protein